MVALPFVDVEDAGALRLRLVAADDPELVALVVRHLRGGCRRRRRRGAARARGRPAPRPTARSAGRRARSCACRATRATRISAASFSCCTREDARSRSARRGSPPAASGRARASTRIPSSRQPHSARKSVAAVASHQRPKKRRGPRRRCRVGVTASNDALAHVARRRDRLEVLGHQRCRFGVLVARAAAIGARTRDARGARSLRPRVAAPMASSAAIDSKSFVRHHWMRLQPLAQLLHPELHARLDRAERLAEARRDLRLRQAFEVRQLQRDALRLGQLRQRAADGVLFLRPDGVVRACRMIYEAGAVSRFPAPLRFRDRCGSCASEGGRCRGCARSRSATPPRCRARRRTSSRSSTP